MIEIKMTSHCLYNFQGILATEILVWLLKHSQIPSNIMREHAFVLFKVLTDLL